MGTLTQWRSKGGGRWGWSTPGGKIEVMPKKFENGKSILMGRNFRKGLEKSHILG